MVKVIGKMGMQTLPQLSFFRMAWFIDLISHVWLDMKCSFFLLKTELLLIRFLETDQQKLLQIKKF